MKIATVVVTYNRKELLLECIEGIAKQKTAPDSVYIVDNCSTDGTKEMLLEKGIINEVCVENLDVAQIVEGNIISSQGLKIKVKYIRLPKNVGGAGGFHEGIRVAYLDGYDWVWLMDDDTIPDENALSVLVSKIRKLRALKIGFACSRAIDENGTVHKMNVPNVSPLINEIPFNAFEDEGVLLVNSCSFVSVLINRSAIECVGLPLKEFFIWVDDVEYTTRITKHGFVGIYVKDSVVKHKSKYITSNGVFDWRFYYFVRNWLWFSKLHEGKKRYLLKFAANLLRTFRLPKNLWFKNVAACFESFIKNPKVVYPVDKKGRC